MSTVLSKKSQTKLNLALALCTPIFKSNKSGRLLSNIVGPFYINEFCVRLISGSHAKSQGAILFLLSSHVLSEMIPESSVDGPL
jgi:hypothetical protein